MSEEKIYIFVDLFFTSWFILMYSIYIYLYSINSFIFLLAFHFIPFHNSFSYQVSKLTVADYTFNNFHFVFVCVVFYFILFCNFQYFFCINFSSIFFSCHLFNCFYGFIWCIGAEWNGIYISWLYGNWERENRPKEIYLYI